MTLPPTRRGFCAALALAAAAAVGCSAQGSSAGSPGATPPSSGKLIVARDAKFYTFDIATRKQTPLGSFPANAFPASPALSPDRKQLAYTYYVVPTDKNDLGGNDLYVMDLTSAKPRIVRAHGEVSGSFEEPAWASDGSGLFATLRTELVVAGQTAGETTKIVRVPLSGSAPVTVASGESPATSSDGKLLSYLTADKQAGPHLWVSNVDGSAARELVANQGFTNFRAPRFSPDSKTLVFAGEGGPTKKSSARHPKSNSLFAFLAPGIAEADGIPMDVWTIKPDGSNLRQVTHALDHSPVPAWSPDGKWIAVAGELYLTLVDVAGRRTVQLLDDARLSGLAWLR